MKSVLKFVKYNKNLLSKLEIDIKDYYKYKYEIKLDNNNNKFYIFFLVFGIIKLFLFLIYFILVCSKGTFKDNNLR